jgi:prepilin-type N-terminal cleavage/methylation domain-containing protein
MMRTALRIARRCKTTHGFTLVELLVALVILTVSASALAMLSSQMSSANYLSKDEASGTALATQKIEQLKATAFASIDSTTCPTSETGLTDTGGSGGVFSRACSYVNGTANGTSTKDITVTVSWVGGGSVTLTTTLADITQLSTGYPVAYVKSWTQTQ